jgi:hypothetical protein
MNPQTHSRILCTTNTPSPDEDAGGSCIVPTKQLAPGEPVAGQAVCEPASLYGCVDWYLYPDPRKEAS